jgi:hypothetical protein
MNKIEATVIAKTVTLEEIKTMFINASQQIKCWEQISTLNKGMSKGLAFNILAAGFGEGIYSTISDIKNTIRINMIREFGEYLPNLTPKIRSIKPKIKIAHQYPRFEILYKKQDIPMP